MKYYNPDKVQFWSADFLYFSYGDSLWVMVGNIVFDLHDSLNTLGKPTLLSFVSYIFLFLKCIFSLAYVVLFIQYAYVWGMLKHTKI